MIYVVLIFFLCSVACEGTFDPCSDSIQLPYMTQRLVNYTLNDGELPICDSYLEAAWYEMGEYVISNTTDECGTGFSWYMNSGHLPEKGTTRVTVCRYENSLNTCVDKMFIGVMKCGKKFVFHLKPLLGCDEAYCIQRLDGEKKTGAPDISSIKQPIIKADLMSTNDNAKQLVFYCDFDALPSTNYIYVVEWSQSTGSSTTRLIYVSKATEYKEGDKQKFKLETALTEEHLRSSGFESLGFTLVCSVAAKKDLAGELSHRRFSAHKFCGIEVLNRTLTLSSGQDATVTMRLTVPFFCKRSPCALRLEMFIPAVDHCSVSNLAEVAKGSTACGIMFYEDDVNKPKQFKITSQMGNRPWNTDINYGVLFKTLRFTSHPLFSHYAPDVVRVHLTEDTTILSGKSCYAHSDPHIKTFDDKTYDNQRDGTFVLYRNKDYKIEVQIKTAKCANYDSAWWKPYCSCGVAIRAGKDVYVLNRCGRSNWYNHFKICDDKVMERSVKMESGGRVFHIKLPTGASIKISIASFAEIDIYPSILDVGKADGMCGNFNGNPGDDITSSLNDFLNHISVSASQSLFERSRYQNLDSWGTDIYLCKCNNNPENAIAHGLENKAECTTTDNKRKTCDDDAFRDVDDMKVCSFARKKRSEIYASQKRTVDIHEDVITDFKPSLDSTKRKTVFKRSVFTKQTAYENCIEEMNTTAFQMCSNVPGLNLSSYVDNCVDDVLAAESTVWTKLHIEELKRICVKTVEENQPIPPEVLEEVENLKTFFNFTNNTDFTNSTDHSTTVTPIFTQPSHAIEFTPDLLKTLKSVTCLNDCSGHGTCDNGKCTCDEGFISKDCSISKDQPPVMLGIPDRGLCDLRQRDCLRTSVFADNIVDNKHLSCRLTPLVMKSPGHLQKKDDIIGNASLRTFEEVTCHLPFERKSRSVSSNINDFTARGYQISVANDGKAFSEPDVIVIFDSECVSCNKTTGSFVCRVKPGYCQSDGMCYAKGDMVGCFTCQGEIPTSLRWTAGPDCPAPFQNLGEQNTKLWIIGATVGPFAALMIGVSVVFYTLKRKQRLAKANRRSLSSLK